jgi:glycosyltransferase involved in cell wall biosynthesis
MSGEATPVPSEEHHRHVAYIVRSFPRLSQTHILNEVLGLERLGHTIQIFGMTRSGETLLQEGVASLRNRAEYLDGTLQRSLVAVVLEHVEIARKNPVRYLATIIFLSRRRDLTAGYTTTTRFRSFMQAVHLATRISPRARGGEDGFDHVHCHFAHDPTLIALLLHKLTGMPYSFTAHARDMYQIPPSSLAARIEHASAVVSICQVNIDYMRRVAPDATNGKFRVVHTGIDVGAWRPPDEDRVSRTIPVIVVVSRLVAKKGMLDLVAALGLVKARGRAFRCVIYGDGPMREELSTAISRLSLTGDVELAGACTQAQLRGVLQRADVFALTPFVTDDGDREGLPSVILEAMSCGLPVVSTAVAGIPEAVLDGETGLLAQPHDVEGIATHVETLLGDDALRRRLGTNARAAIVTQWSAGSVARELASVFDAVSGRHP